MSDEQTLPLSSTHCGQRQRWRRRDRRAREEGSFLEKTLRDALAGQLPRASTEHPLNLDQALWPGRLGGVDVLYVPDDGTHVGVETKVWDVPESLYDIFKLAAATQSGRLAMGFCVIAGRSRDWRAATAISQMSDRRQVRRVGGRVPLARLCTGLGVDMVADADPTR